MSLSLPRQFLLLCLFRIGPQDLPAGGWPVLVAALGYLLVSVLGFGPALGHGDVAVEAMTDILVLAAYIGALLRLRGHPERYFQTLTAAYGLNFMLGLLAWPIIATEPGLLGEVNPDTFQASLPDYLLLGLLFWNLMVLGHVLRHALQLQLWQGFLAALAYLILSVLALDWLDVA
ncbi:MAG: hypothetical protein PHI49_04835 [Halothiobacillaceae bacterium]|jgi:hypothetical protein|nr:hypothetical protein [Halothiobacillaceae bacterium]